MRANFLPDAKLVLDTYDWDVARKLKPQVGAALKKAAQHAAYSTGVVVGFRKVEERVLAQSSLVKLVDWPAWDLSVNNVPVLQMRGENLDTRLGLLYANLSLGEHLLKYSVGYKEGEVPALVVELVTRLTRYYLLKSEEQTKDIIPLIQIQRTHRKQESEERELLAQEALVDRIKNEGMRQRW